MTGVYVTIGLIGGLACGFAASSRGRSGIAWFVIGFLLPLIGFVLVLALPPAQAMELVAPEPLPVSLEQQAKAAAVARDASLDALAKLGEMRERGLVTEAEFEGKKRELLARV